MCKIISKYVLNVHRIYTILYYLIDQTSGFHINFEACKSIYRDGDKRMILGKIVDLQPNLEKPVLELNFHAKDKPFLPKGKH